jgi:hypothetical protein
VNIGSVASLVDQRLDRSVQHIARLPSIHCEVH